jgi:glycine/D-amino acid oxidase-like deaminating enzyme/nitrite reductase/ring-hydroxylating ferredoxin subunit
MGRLDGPNPSLWAGTTPEGASQPLSGETGADVCVIGAGIAGLCTAMLLAEAGRSVAVVDSGRIASGVTGYTTAKITALHGLKYGVLIKTFGEPTARTYAEANQSAVEDFARIVREQGIDCDFRRAPAFTYTEDDAWVEAIRAEADALTRFGLKASVTTATSLPFAVKAAVRLEDQALFHPRKFALAAAQFVREHGGQIYDQTRATDVKHDGDACVVQTENGSIRALHTVIATHLPFPGQGEYYNKTWPSRSYALALRIQGDIPEGMFLNAESPVRSIRPHPTSDGTYLLVGGEGHRVGEEPDTERRYKALETWARERFGSDVEVAYRWSAQDYMPADGVPFIGQLDAESQRIFVATGFGKWGMSNGMVAARILTDRIRGVENPWAPAFDSLRKVRGKVPDAGDNTLQQAPSPSDIPPGEARLVMRDGKKLAVYREKSGVLHVVAAECTHMGCIVGWNTADQSWDCNCHGSRFDLEGKVMQAPATKDLEQVTVIA